MNYNGGNIHLDFYEQKEKYNKIAEEFSEGDKLLKQILLDLWEKGFKTDSCCNGHDENSLPYISLIIVKN